MNAKLDAHEGPTERRIVETAAARLPSQPRLGATAMPGADGRIVAFDVVVESSERRGNGYGSTVSRPDGPCRISSSSGKKQAALAHRLRDRMRRMHARRRRLRD